MRILLLTSCLLLVASCNGDRKPLPDYVKADSLTCNKTGIYFVLTDDRTISDLALDTGLRITLYPGGSNTSLEVPDEFNPATGQVHLDYEKHSVQAVVAYGPNQVPLLYNIQQPFLAIPNYETTVSTMAETSTTTTVSTTETTTVTTDPTASTETIVTASGVITTAGEETTGWSRVYRFAIYCTIPAYYHVNISTGTVDDGTGNPPIDVVDPGQHFNVEVEGFENNTDITIGESLKYVISVKDEIYLSAMPLSCQFYNPKYPSMNIPFVLQGCPVVFPDDQDGYFNTMKQITKTKYELEFRAFAFEQDAYSQLGIDCFISACVIFDEGPCTQACWGDVGPTELTTAGSETTPTISDASEATAAISEETPGPVGKKRRKRDVTHLNRAVVPTSSQFESQVVRSHDALLFVSTEQPPDYRLLHAMYGIAGALGFLTLVLLVVVVSFLFYRQKKLASDQEVLYRSTNPLPYDRMSENRGLPRTV